MKQSPSVWLPRKELHHFGADLTFNLPTPTRREYEIAFEAAGDRLTGDVSVWYLYSQTAPNEIRDYAPNARLIVALRNPVDFMYSMHSQALFQNDETEPSFARALELEGSRMEGRDRPQGAYAPHAVYYRHVAQFATQIGRYLDVFPRHQMHFVLLDDIARNPKAVWEQVCSFLGISPAGVSEFAVANPNKVPRLRIVNRSINRFRRSVVPQLGLGEFPDTIKSAGKKLLRTIQVANTRQTARPPMDHLLRTRLLREFDSEISDLERILERDLSEWRLGPSN